MIKINLAPEVQQKKAAESKIRYISTIIGVAIVGSTVFTLAILGGWYAFNGSMIKGTNENIVTVEKEIENYGKLKNAVISLEKGLKAAKNILSGKNRLTSLFAHLEQVTPSDVTFKNLSVTGEEIRAGLNGSDVNSLARFADSYKFYTIAKISGQSKGEKITLSFGEEATVEFEPEKDGSWSYVLPIDPNKDYVIMLDDGSGPKNLKYSAKKKDLEESFGVSFVSGNLFSNIKISQYTKDGNNVTFDAIMTFERELLW